MVVRILQHRADRPHRDARHSAELGDQRVGDALLQDRVVLLRGERPKRQHGERRRERRRPRSAARSHPAPPRGESPRLRPRARSRRSPRRSGRPSAGARTSAHGTPPCRDARAPADLPETAGCRPPSPRRRRSGARAPCAAPSARSCRDRRTAPSRAGASRFPRASAPRVSHTTRTISARRGSGARRVARPVEQLVEHHAQGIDVARGSHRLAAHLLGARVVRRQQRKRVPVSSTDAPRAPESMQLGDAEVEQLRRCRRSSRGCWPA